MKDLLVYFAALLGPSLAAQAQLLPVPEARNPDWTLLNKKPGTRPNRPDLLAGSRDLMPIVDPTWWGPVANMPHALPGSISGFGNTHRYWDAERRLTYEWHSPGRTAPDSVATVQQLTRATYTYRKRPKPALPQYRLRRFGN